MTEPNKQESIYGKKFGIMLEIIPHPDGGYWTGSKMKQASGNAVGPSYFTSLRNGAIDIPRVDKIEAIANAMNFPTELWFKDISWWESLYERWKNGDDIDAQIKPSRGSDGSTYHMTALVNRLFEARTNEQTALPFTEEEVAARSDGALSSTDVAALRSGELKDPTWGQLLALSEIFGVGLSYFSGSEVSLLPLETEPSAANSDQDSYITFRNSVDMNKQKRSLLRSMSENLRREYRRTKSDEASEGDEG